MLMHLKHGQIRIGGTKQLNVTLWPIWQLPETDQKVQDKLCV